MSANSMSEVIQRLCGSLLSECADLTDGQLLERYLSQREPAAVTALVERHGSMVWGVCCRVLQNHQDAEDAFQATFLVLVRKAASIRSRAKIGNWLYGVAHQTALKARATIARRKAREMQVGTMPEPATAEPEDWSELQPVLDQELSRLPEKYRTVVVQCDLEGKTKKEAARLLGLPQGTVASRLARARVLLAKRLSRQGLAIPVATLATLLSRTAASAAVPAAVLNSTIRVLILVGTGVETAPGLVSPEVVALSKGVMKTMFLNKLWTLTISLLLLAGIGLGTAIGLPHLLGAQVAAEPGGTQGAPPRKGSLPAPPKEGPEAEVEALKKEIEALRQKVEALGKKEEQPPQQAQKIVVTSPQTKDVDLTQQYVGKIHSHRHINVRTLQSGYLEEILVKEGQAVKKGDVLFKILPTLYKAKLDAELAEAQLAQIDFQNVHRLFKDKVVTQTEVDLAQAKLARAQAKVKLAQAELDFTAVRAPFDSLVGRLQMQQGSLVKEGEVITTLSDNSVLWVYFNVPEVLYLQYVANLGQEKAIRPIELVLADGRTFPHTGKINVIEADFNNETGHIPFRADFPNPDGLLRHGQTGTVLIHRTLKNALVIPQRATFEVLDKRYVYVVGHDDVVHRREIVIQEEMNGLFVVKKGLDWNDRIVLEGVRQVRDGDKVQYEFRKPEEVMANPTNQVGK